MLDRLFSPKSIAVIGASKTVGKVGYYTVSNLVQSGFKGPIIPVNSAGGELFGLKVYPKLADYADPVDLVVIAVPAEMVPAAAQEAVREKSRSGRGRGLGFQGNRAAGSGTGRRIDRDLPQGRGPAARSQLPGRDQHHHSSSMPPFRRDCRKRATGDFFPVRGTLHRHDGYCRRTGTREFPRLFPSATRPTSPRSMSWKPWPMMRRPR
jgi:hypothetical protein